MKYPNKIQNGVNRAQRNVPRPQGILWNEAVRICTSLISGVHRGREYILVTRMTLPFFQGIKRRGKQSCWSSRTVVWLWCLTAIQQFLPFSYRVMLKDFQLKKRAAVWFLSFIAMLVLARLIGATTRSCLPKNACTTSTRRVFLDVIGITRPAVSVQCAKRNTSTTPLEHWTDISITELKAMLTANNVQLFDVREPHELVETGKIACATNVPCM